MAFADLDVITDYVTGTYLGGDDGMQQVNAKLSDPLALQGDDCRRWQLDHGAVGDKRSMLLLLDATSEPDFNPIVNTYKHSIRANVRFPQYGMGGFAKTRQTFLGGGDSAVGLTLRGGAFAANGLPDGITLVFGKGEFSNNSDKTSGGATLSVQAQKNGAPQSSLLAPDIWFLSTDEWHGIRIDVEPVEANRDLIKVFVDVGTEASPIWKKVWNDEVPFVDARSPLYGDATHSRCGIFLYNVLETAGSGSIYQNVPFVDSLDVRRVAI